MTSVTYHQTTDGQTTTVTNVCFYRLYGSQMPDSIRYAAPIKPTLTLPMVEHWCAFLVRLFDDQLFTYEIRMADAIPVVEWTFKSKGLNYISALVRLTAFRYPDEFAPIVKKFAAEQGTDDELFAAFQRIHVALQRNPSNLSGHGLMYFYPPPDSANYVSINEFRARLKEPSRTVHAYFKPLVPQPIAFVPVLA